MTPFSEHGDNTASDTLAPDVIALLRDNVQTALGLLGNALLERTPPARSRAQVWQQPDEYYAQLLRLLYQLMFLLIVEARDLLHPQDTADAVREHYRLKRGVSRLASLEDDAYDPASSDLWRGLKAILGGLAHGDADLGLPALGGIFAPRGQSLVDEGTLGNQTLLKIARLLMFSRVNDPSTRIDWSAVGGEHLGSIYEQLLALVPEIDAATSEFRIQTATTGTTTRRSSGSYYTPRELVDVVMTDALDRRISECLTRDAQNPRESLLGLRVVDPACGCGYFLRAAARRIATCLEPHLPEPPSVVLRTAATRPARALRLVIANCIYGVDLNPMAIELCKMNLWLDAAEPGLALSFLDQHVQQGNALIGAPTDAVSRGLTHRAQVVANKPRRQTFERNSPAPVAETATSDADLSLDQRQGLADLWCAAFFWQGGTSEQLGPHALHDAWQLQLRGAADPAATLAVGRRLALEHGFFHWHLRFHDVFAAGGFDVVLGNPPWIAHAGRAAQPLDVKVKHFYASNYPAFSKYITTHGLFASVLPKVLRPGGYLGFIIPSSLSELAGYEPTRKAHDALCAFVDELTDFGEGRFEGVTQPCMALITRRDANGRTDAALGAPWPVARPDLSPADRELLSLLSGLPALPASLFAERGLQSDPSLRAHFLESAHPHDRFTVPVREGTDVREFELMPARYHVDPHALGKRLRAAAEFQQVAVLVRQTARYPIAAISDGLAFRNSLLACLTHPDLSAPALAALLNSTLVRWHHYMRFRDARQPILPQVKISHLRAIPAPPNSFAAVNDEFTHLGSAMASAPSVARAAELRRELDAAVARAYGLSQAQVGLLMRWASN